MPVKWLLFVVCALAAVTDILWRRIPNVWLFAGFLTGIFLVGEGAAGYVKYLCRAVIALGTLYPVWRLRAIGGGDVKLCCVMAAGIGIRHFAACFLYGLFFSGIMAVCQMIRCKNFYQRFSYFLAWFRRCISSKKWVPYLSPSEISRENTVPFSAAIFLGYIFWMGQTFCK